MEHEYLYYQCNEKYKHKNPYRTTTGQSCLPIALASQLTNMQVF